MREYTFTRTQCISAYSCAYVTAYAFSVCRSASSVCKRGSAEHKTAVHNDIMHMRDCEECPLQLVIQPKTNINVSGLAFG